MLTDVCSLCGGTGEIERHEIDEYYDSTEGDILQSSFNCYEPCTHCGGLGLVPNTKQAKYNKPSGTDAELQQRAIDAALKALNR